MTWDAIVIGAGPAGAFSALMLARAGARTLIVERKRFPRQKVCGGCLNAESVALLRAAGLGDALRSAGARPLSSIQLRHGARHANVPLPPGLAVTRATLDTLLLKAAIDAGCELRYATANVLADDSTAPDIRAVRLAQPDAEPVTLTAKLIVAADGLGHASLRELAGLTSIVEPDARVGVGAVGAAGCIDALPGVVTMAIASSGYVGVAGVEGAQVNVAAALDPAFLKSCGTPARAVREILRSTGIEASDALDALDWQGTIPLTRRLARPVGHRLFVLGDAAGYVEPFTGEGMTWALSAARALGPIGLRAIERWDAAIEREWLEVTARLVTHRQRRCRVVARALRHPAVVGAAVAALSHWPRLARPFIAQVAAGSAPVPVELGP